ncbi:hypothetical protein [Cohnella terricola]|nr:hypothetical protein [Cohnella terricola]
MEKEMPIGNHENQQPLEVDIRKILEQLGIHRDKWPEEYKDPVR